MSLFKKPKVTNEYAKVIEWNPPWCTGAPLPQVFSNGHKIFLIYQIDDLDPNWDGTYSTRIDHTSDTIYGLALVQFDGGTFRFGIANDEVFDGLSLWGKGLESYAAHVVENSTWIEELKNINKVHDRYDENLWKDEKHYLLLFHDEILEVIARDYKIETFKTTFQQLATEVARLMNS